ncbi:deoxynucleoside kinase [Ambystoma tigrinum stebbensi virus]|uniref:Deoxynucleoside kinase n=2 Tax=Ranavirus ambystoma1 TaxID=265294 RepID=Q6YHA6_9VIRU|nr:thymidylate kinase [Ambystoma tigrinum virus]AAP33196.1 deoxynucleoside kinase [Ambystoma tigrinum stebbensi virus]ALN36514.1 putative deoxynucleoside kinase [Ambystoma tigrinum virus]
MSIPTVIAFSGNIGAGKSTLLRGLEAAGYEVVPEDFSRWAQLFKMALEDPNRWKFSSQLKIMLTQSEIQRDAKKSDSRVVVLERTTECVLDFCDVAMEQGQILPAEYDMLVQIWEKVNVPVDAKIFLNTPPEKCMERIAVRGREFERDIPVEYLSSLHSNFARDPDYIMSGLESNEVVLANAIELIERIVSKNVR